MGTYSLYVPRCPGWKKVEKLTMEGRMGERGGDGGQLFGTREYLNFTTHIYIFA